MGMNQHDLDLLTKYEKDLISTLNLTCLLPHLKECNLLTPNEAESLTKPELTRQSAITKFLLILKTKGQDAFSLFTSALRKENEHLGHASLYKMFCDVQHSPHERVEQLLQETSTMSKHLTEPHLPPNLSLEPSQSPLKLNSDSQISHISSQGSSRGSSTTVSSVSSEALSLVSNELLQKMSDNSEKMNELTTELKKMHEVF